jgi:branched-chain amino acid transport system ATP-binding protein
MRGKMGQFFEITVSEGNHMAPDGTGNKNGTIVAGRDLSLSFGGIKALSNVDFQVRRGEIVSIIGPNGAGKTCLVNCITGYYRPQKGTITYDGRDITGLPSYRIARLGISRTFQNPSLYPHMTAFDNLMLARYMHTRTTLPEAMLFFGRSRREEIEGRRFVESIISFARIQDLSNRTVATMSYGQRKLVEIARALAMEPRIIFLDEPMSGLDEVMKELVAELIISIRNQGITVVLVEHDMQVVMGLSNSVIVLDFGQKIAEGSPDDVCRNSQVTAAYIGGIVAGRSC